jgi:glucosamine-6-phosphate deaminase
LGPPGLPRRGKGAGKRRQEERPMNVIIMANADAVTKYAYEFVRDRMKRKRYRVLGLPTGSTPLRLYRALVEGFKRSEVDFADVHTFNLDEYLGLPADHPQSYRCFMQTNLFAHVNIKPDNVHFLSGLPADIEEECEAYERAIKELGGLKLQILGIGRDGHIGFNEPTSSLASRTREKTLTRATIEDNRRFFENEAEVPRWALTMGVGTIMEAREILLLATGRSKADAVRAMIEGPVTAMCTASALQMHPRVTVVIDEAAAAKLDHDDYYRWMSENDCQMAGYLEECRQRYADRPTAPARPGN